VTLSKYHARATTVDGIRFASAAEARRYSELILLQSAGEITDLELQPHYKCVVNGQNVATYIADFRYIEHGKVIVEDVKGVRTPVYRLKKKLVEALYGIEIVEIDA
jgi:hypothetical protein